jgi:FkbM family methyltransferase
VKRAFIDLYKRLFVRKALYGLHRRLLNISLWGVGVLNSEDDRGSGEEHFLRALPGYLGGTADFTVFDIGANVGRYADRVKALYPRARVYAFEPNPACFRRLQERARAGGYLAFNQGMGDVAGRMTLYDQCADGGSEHASLYQEVIESLHGSAAAAIEVEVSTVDRFVGEHGIDRIDLLKTDTEGHDLQVLRGALETIRAERVGLIQFEFNEMNSVSRAFFRDFCALLPDHDFFRLLPDGPVPLRPEPPFLGEIFAFQNIIARRRK